MPTISTSGMALLIGAFGQTQAQSLRPVLEQSSTLVSMLNSFAAERGGPTIQLGPPGYGSSASGTVITIDPYSLPNSGQADYALSPPVFATLLGHELGHATQPGGEANFSGLTSYAAAVNQGDNAEGIALLQEYQVASEEAATSGQSVTMQSGGTVQSLIAQAVQAYTPGSTQYQAAGIGLCSRTIGRGQSVCRDDHPGDRELHVARRTLVLG
jgi:hypothetical protein